MTGQVPAVDWWAQVVVALGGEENLDQAVATDPATCPARLTELAAIDDEFVQTRVAHNPSTPAAVLADLIDSRFADDVLLNPAAPPEILERAWRRADPSGIDMPNRIDTIHALLEHQNTPLELVVELCPLLTGPVRDRAVLFSGRSDEVAAALGVENLDARQRRWWTGDPADVFNSDATASEDEVIAALYRPAVTAEMVEQAFTLHTTLKMSYEVAGHRLVPPHLHAQLLARGCRPPLLLGATALKNSSYPAARWSVPLEVLAHAGLGSAWLPDLQAAVAEIVVGLAGDWAGDMRCLLDAASEVVAVA